MVERRGAATSSRFSPAVLGLASGGGGGNDAAFIKAQPDWRPEDNTVNEEKEEG
jgi:hypothetical protein